MIERTIEIRNISKGLRTSGQRRDDGALSDCLNLCGDASGKLKSFSPVCGPKPVYVAPVPTWSVPILFNASSFADGSSITVDSLNNALNVRSYNWSTFRYVDSATAPKIVTLNGVKYCQFDWDSEWYRQFDYTAKGALNLTGDFTVELFVLRDNYSSISFFSLGDMLNACFGGDYDIRFPRGLLFSDSIIMNDLRTAPYSYVAMRRENGVLTGVVNSTHCLAPVNYTGDLTSVFYIGSVADGSSYPKATGQMKYAAWRVTVGRARDISTIPTLPLTVE